MAAQDAELKLKVSLDLAFFRQQLAGLGQAAAGYNIPVNVRFDRRSVQNELNALSVNIRRRNYTLEVKTNLQAEISNAAKLAKALRELERASIGAASGSPIGTTALKKTPGQGGLSAAEIKKLFSAAVKGGLIDSQIIAKTRADMVTALGSIGKDSIQGLLNGLESGNAQLKAAAKTLGQDLIASVKNVLGIASPSREFEKIGEDAGKGFEIGLLKAIDIAEQSASRRMRKMLDRLARMALMMSGMSANDISRQAGQLASASRIAAPDWNAVRPSRSISIGPSSSGRALPQGAIPGALPGTAFRQQKYLPTDLGVETKKILRDAAYAFLDAVKQGVRTVNVQDLGVSPSRQPLLGAGRIAGLLPGRAAQANVLELNNILAGAIREYFKAIAAEIRKGPQGAAVARSFALPAGRQIAGLLPPAGGTTPRVQMRFNAVSAGAVLGQPSFMRAPSIPRAAGGGVPPVPPVPPGGGGGGGGMGGFGRAMGGINLPGAGTIRELGSEFAFATKQVLLFGQAYKLLGFIQAFPGQVGQAVAQLQSFRNTLDAVSPTAEEAASSNRLILDLVEKYNVPLQSARDGFTKLYASMAPAGFKGDEVRELFTGITKAAATFGMSADKVDRVNYAFAQMASKGQVMSEELKGQLGDVLPGAMALFAKAAGFEGPEAIQDFSAALEDGRYKGEAMVALLKNVGIVMNKEFGPGAEGAALTFQGIINRMQNSMKLLYESFEPVAVEFLNAVVVPLTDGIKQLSDGFTAFFSGSAAKTAGGFAIAQELERLKPAFDGIRANAAQLGQVFAQFGKIALDVAKVLLQIAGNPFVGYLARVYANVLILTTAVQILNLRALVPLIASFTRSAYALIAFTVQCARAGQAAQVMGLMVRTAGITLRTFFATTGVGLVLVGIGLLIERFTTMNQRLDETRQKAIGAASAIRMMSGTEAIAAERSYGGMARSLEGLNAQLEQGKFKGKAWIAVNKQQQAALEAAGVIPSIVRGQAQIQPFRIAGAYQKVRQLESEAGYRRTQLQFEETQALQPVQLGAIPPSEAEGKTRGGKELKDFTSDQVRLLQSRLELTKRYISTQIELSKRQRELSIADTEYAFGLKIIEAQYAEAVRQANEYKEAQRAAALQEAKNFKTIAEQETVYEYRKALLGDLLDLSDQYDKQTSELNTSIGALTQGELKLTEAAKLEALITQQTTGYKAEQLEVVKPLLDKLRAQAKALDDLADKDKKLREAIEKRQELEKKVKEKLTDLRQEIQLLRAVNDEEARRLEIAQEYEGATKEELNRIYDLEKIRDNIKAVRELIDSFVTDTTSDYKNFLGEIISGKDAGDALREFQKSLKDRVLKIFLDFSMAPVEKFFKESLGQFALDKLFPKADIEKTPEETKKETALATALETAATDVRNLSTDVRNLTTAITTPAVSPGVPQAPGSGPVAIPIIPYAASETTEALAQTFANDASLFASSISSVDSSLKDATISIANAAEEASPNGATGKKWQQSLGAAVQGIGIAAGSIMGIIAGISQMKEGGTSNVLGGIGSIALSLGGLLGGIGSLGGLFGGGGGAAATMGGANYYNPQTGLGVAGPNFGLANGGIMRGGFTPFRAFANGGIVTGPTLGLVGEGRFSEAVVPLPNGRSIPVQLGGRTARDLMGGNAPGMPQQTSLNMSFETTKINGTEYVSREQLERAMAETRRASIAGGARQGMSMTLDRIQQSPSVRSRIGIR